MLAKRILSAMLIVGMGVSTLYVPERFASKGFESGVSRMLAPKLGQAYKPIKQTTVLPHFTEFLNNMFENAKANSSHDNPENILHYMGLDLESIEAIPGGNDPADIEFIENLAQRLNNARENTPEILRAKAVMAQQIVGVLGSLGAYGASASGNPGMKIKADEDAFANFIHSLKYVASHLGVQFVTMTAEGADDGSLSLRPKQAIGNPDAPKLYLIVDPVEITNGMIFARQNPRMRSNVAISVVYVPEENESSVSFPPDKKNAYMRYDVFGKWVSMGGASDNIKLSLTDSVEKTVEKILYSLNMLSQRQKIQLLRQRNAPEKDFERIINQGKTFEVKDITVAGLWRERMRSRLRKLIVLGLDVGPFAYTDDDGHVHDLMRLAQIYSILGSTPAHAIRFDKAFEKFVEHLNKTVKVEGTRYGKLFLCDAGEAPLFFGAASGAIDYIAGMGGPAERYFAAVGHLVAQLPGGADLQMKTRFINKDATNNMAEFKKRVWEQLVPLTFPPSADLIEHRQMGKERLALALKKNPFGTDKSDILVSPEQLDALFALHRKYITKFSEWDGWYYTDRYKMMYFHDALDVLLEDYSALMLHDENVEALKDVNYVHHFGSIVNVQTSAEKMIPVTRKQLLPDGLPQAGIFQAYISGPNGNAGDGTERFMGKQVGLHLKNGRAVVDTNSMIAGQTTPLNLRFNFVLHPYNDVVDEAKRFIRFGQFDEARDFVYRNFIPGIIEELEFDQINALKDLYLRLIDLSEELMTSTSIDGNAELAAAYEQLIIDALALRAGRQPSEIQSSEQLILSLLHADTNQAALATPAIDHAGFVVRHAVLELKGIYDIDVDKKLGAIDFSEQKLYALTSMEHIAEIDSKTPRIIPRIRIHQALNLRNLILGLLQNEMNSAA